MTREDIINMAAQAGIDETVWVFNDEAIERFAALVAAAEREACAKLAGPHLGGEIAAAIRARGET